ncbi:MAG: PKD domain-containing protein [Bacteroidia bacterium]|nr:PKD domain-containing protein [Bacteroidia bacterium]
MERYISGLVIFIGICCSIPRLLAQPVADFQADTTYGCAPIVVTFKDLSTDAVSWHWNTGVGSSTLQNPGVIYTQPGVYSVTLIVTNASGQKDTLTRVNYINTYGNPVADFSANVVNVCSHTPVAFTDQTINTSGNLISWFWDFGDGTTSTSQHPVHPYSSPGVYPVSLIVQNQYQCSDDKILNAYIRVNAPNVSFSATNLLACGPPLTSSFTSTGDTTGTHFWDFGDGNTSSQVHPMHTYLSNGSYDVTHITEDAQGCRDTLTKNGLVNIGVNTLSLTVNDTAICVGDTIFFTTNAATNSNIEWDFGNGSSSNGFVPYYIYANPGSYHIVATVSDVSGCIYDLQADVSVYPRPNPWFVASSPKIGCEVPFTVQFQDQSTNAVSWLWNFWDGTSSTAQHPAHTFTTIDTFNIRLTVTGAGGCTSTRTLSDFVQIREINNGFGADYTSGCAPLDVAFSDTTESPYPVISWKWNFGDGTTSLLQNPTHTYPDTGYYTVSLITVNSMGCTDTLTRSNYISVGEKPNISFAADTNRACALTDVQFINTTTGANEYIWYFGDGDTAMSFNPSHGFAAIGDMAVVLTASDRGCWDTLSQSNVVHVLAPLPVIGISQKYICDIPATVFFSNLSIGADTWAWTLADTMAFSGMSFSHTFHTQGFHHVELQVGNDTTGCQISAIDSIYIHPVTADFEADTNRGCVPLQIRFTDFSENAIKWKWYFGNGDTSLLKNPVYTYKTPGTYPVTLIVENSIRCRDTFVFNPGIFALGVNADFTVAEPNAGCVPLALSFSDQSSGTGSITAWNWNLGDGTTANTPQVSHTYIVPDYYTVRLTVEDEDGCVDSVIRDNFVFATQPIPAFTINPTINCPGANTVFVSQSSGVGLTYHWDFGDGDTSLLANTLHAYSDTGFYDVTLYLSDVNGCDTTLTLPQIVEIRELVADFEADTMNASCPPLAVNFTALGSFPHTGVTWAWNFGDGATSSQPNPTHVYTAPGVFTVQLVVSTPSGCADTLVWQDMITVLGPVTTFTFDPESGCPGTTVNFSASSPEDSIVYEWIFGDGNTGIGQNISYTYLAPGKYVPVLRVEDNTGCQIFTIAPDTLTIHQLPVAAFTANTAVLCDSGAVTFVDQSVSDGSIIGWWWDFGDGSTATVKFPTHIYHQLGSYDVTLVVTSSEGCRDTLIKPGFISVRPSPKPSILAIDATGCSPLLVSFQVLTNGHIFPFIDYQWDFGYNNGTSTASLPTFVYSLAGSYQTHLTVTDINGCTATVQRPITVYPLPSPNFAAEDSFGCAPFTTSLHNLTDIPTIAWDWDFGDGNTSFDSLPTHTWSQDGIYSVRLMVTDTNGCEAAFFKPDYIHLNHPTAAFSAIDTVICPGSAIAFRDLSWGDTLITGWNWNFGNGFTSHNPNPLQIFPTSGLYDISLTVTDIWGCSDQATRSTYIEVVPDIIPKILDIQYVSVLNEQQVEVVFSSFPNVYNDFGRYVIYRMMPGGGYDSIGVIYDISHTRFLDNGLNTLEESYCYKIQVVNSCGTAYDINLAEEHCTVNLVATGFVDEILLEWNPYTGWDHVENYMVFRVNDFDPQQMTLLTTMPGNATQFSDRETFCYDPLAYRIVAIGPGHLQSYSDTAYGTPVHIPPSDPGHIVRVTVENNRQIQVEWDAAAIDKASEVVVERNSGQGYQEVFRENFAAGNTKFQDVNTDVIAQSYEYQVSTIDSCGDYTPVGRKGKSILLKAERKDGEITLQWNFYEGWENGVDHYEIQLIDPISGSFASLVNVPGGQNFYKDDQANSSQAMNCYRVIAWESGGTATTSMSNESCVVLDPRIHTANAFTPNGDGTNDYFTVQGAFLTEYKLEIFNRWGDKIFESSSMDNAWKGETKSGLLAPEGVYVFIARGVGHEGEKIQRVGSVTLLR